MKKLALHWQILLGMALGVVFALILTNFGWGPGFIEDWVKPFGTIFINALKLIAVPLILASLIKGVSDLKDISSLSQMGLRTIVTYVITTVIAVSIGLGVVNLIKPGKTITEETRSELVEAYGGEAEMKRQDAQRQKDAGPLKALVDLVPDNIIGASSSNRNMLQVIFFAIFFGIGLILIPEKTAQPVKDFFDGFNEVILKMIDLIMLAAPYGVFALLAALVVEAPSADLFAALGMYALCVVGGLALMIGVYILLVWIFTRHTPKSFLNGIGPVSYTHLTLPTNREV